MLRRLLPFTALVVAACAANPPPAPAPKPMPVPAATERGELIGLSAQDLGSRLGAPSFQVREGSGVKLQWSGGGCVLDVYLYPGPSGGGVERVTHVDARRKDGEDIDPASCEASLVR